ncbi:MAG: DNA repair protein RadC [Leptospirales bacterium]
MPLYLKSSSNIKILELPLKERPREKIRNKGIESLTNRELIATILGKGTKKNSVMNMANLITNIIEKHGIDDLIHNLAGIHGLGEAKIFTLCACFEFSRRFFKPDKHIIHHPEDIFHWVKEYSKQKQEYFIVFSLNGANEILMRRIVTIGLLNSSQIHPREVFADPITDRAAAIILAHNHPSGISEASPEDIQITQKLKAAGDILGIPILDHIIFSQTGFSSMLEEGLM